MDGSERLGVDAGSEQGMLRPVALADRYDVSKRTVLLSGVQAMIRLPLMQRAQDAARKWNTAGYVTGYRGSPLGGVDLAAWKAKAQLEAAQVTFEPALNEDMAATMIWGAQQAHLRGQGAYSGVFALWYGKGPGLDRTGDVFRHGNLAGVGPKGGVLVAMGDDHTCESSTSCHQTDVTLMDAHIPVLHPAGPQEILDYGLIGWALSRFTGCWVGLKCLKDTVEATTVVDGSIDRIVPRTPEVPLPPQGMNIILGETPHAQEARLIDWRLPAVAPFARLNGLDARKIGVPGARFGVVSSGKSWLDLLSALDLLGIDALEAERLGLTAYKVGLAWPLDGEGLRDFAQGLDRMMVVEEKRSFLETQAKEALYALPDRPQVIGKTDGEGRTLFSAKMDLNPLEIAEAIADQILAMAPDEARIHVARERVRAARREADAPKIAERIPYFCSGCPHNSSTKVPDGSRAEAGIGCHYMVQWMDRETIGFTHMGGEGAQWIGESRFSKESHIFQNIGDGTYNHSGLMAIRAAVASGVNITYKLLYNDAVAMTGGQPNDGYLTPYRAAEELLAAGVKRVVAVVDPKEEIDRGRFPAVVAVRDRADLDQVQRELRKIEGVSVLLYVQTCAAEKRRRRKRGQFPDVPKRVFINPLVCEGCGDCGRKSNCVSIIPKETAFGRKRQIDQSSCNKDLSCIDGFCPSFVTVKGATVKTEAADGVEIPALPEPALPTIGESAGATWNLMATGVGGTGVVTVGALLGMAAHLEGKGAGVMEMAGLAQKGGAVHIHVKIAERPDEVTAIRVGAGAADAVIGGDLVVTGGEKALGVMAKDRTRVVSNDFEIVTGDFTRDTEFSLPSARLKKAIETKVGAGAAQFFNATRLAERLLGDAIYANVLMLGAGWQKGLVPLSGAALRRAIELNGAGVAGNLRAFEIGRWAAHDPAAVGALLADEAAAPAPETLDQLIDRRAEFLTGYQDLAWAARFRDRIAAVRRAEHAVDPRSNALTEAAAKSLFKLMSYKDEYEVARLHAETIEQAVGEAFDDVQGLEFHLAPPLIAPKGSDGRPRKIRFGGWMLRVFKALRHGKRLRGGWADPFGWTAERRMERALITRFESDLTALASGLTREKLALAVEIAALPQSIRGFGHVKERNAAAAAERRAALMLRFEDPTAPETGPDQGPGHGSGDALKIAAE